MIKKKKTHNKTKQQQQTTCSPRILNVPKGEIHESPRAVPIKFDFMVPF